MWPCRKSSHRIGTINSEMPASREDPPGTVSLVKNGCPNNGKNEAEVGGQKEESAEVAKKGERQTHRCSSGTGHLLLVQHCRVAGKRSC